MKAPPESPLIHISVDVSQRLEAIAEAPITSDWQLHQAINNGVCVCVHARLPCTVSCCVWLCACVGVWLWVVVVGGRSGLAPRLSFYPSVFIDLHDPHTVYIKPRFGARVREGSYQNPDSVFASDFLHFQSVMKP